MTYSDVTNEIQIFKLLSEKLLFSNINELLGVDPSTLDLDFMMKYRLKPFNQYAMKHFIKDNELIKQDYISEMVYQKIKYPTEKLYNILINHTDFKDLISDMNLNESLKDNTSHSNESTQVEKESQTNIDSVQGFNSNDFNDSNKTKVDNTHDNTNKETGTNDRVSTRVKQGYHNSYLDKLEKTQEFYKNSFIYDIIYSTVKEILFNNNY